eukprot:Sspe_Gene.11839::Locus_4020_Transcript_1_1_Confidence_1.000_Length_2345::g.11839::m.11839
MKEAGPMMTEAPLLCAVEDSIIAAEGAKLPSADSKFSSDSRCSKDGSEYDIRAIRRVESLNVERKNGGLTDRVGSTDSFGEAEEREEVNGNGRTDVTSGSPIVKRGVSFKEPSEEWQRPVYRTLSDRTIPAFNDTVGSFLATDLESTVKETNRKNKGEDDEGNKTINQYSVIADLGRGSFSKVKLAVDNDSDEVRAMKVMKKSILVKTRASGGVSAMDNVCRELALLKKMQHPNVVRLYEVIDDPKDDKLYLIFEYLEKGELLKLDDEGFTEGGKGLPIDRVRNLMVDIVQGVSYLHQHLIAHRDIKPENLLLDKNDHVKVSDFGVSRAFDSALDASQMRDFEGTPMFLAPEILDGAEEVDAFPADVWAVGVTFYVMLFGRLPYFAKNLHQFTRLVLENPLETPEKINGAADDLLHRLLDKNPATRVTMLQLQSHPFFDSDALDDEYLAEGFLGERQNTLQQFETVDVDPTEIAAAMTERKWTNLSFMVVKVRSQLKQRKKRAQENLRSLSPSLSCTTGSCDIEPANPSFRSADPQTDDDLLKLEVGSQGITIEAAPSPPLKSPVSPLSPSHLSAPNPVLPSFLVPSTSFRPRETFPPEPPGPLPGETTPKERTLPVLQSPNTVPAPDEVVTPPVLPSPSSRGDTPQNMLCNGGPPASAPRHVDPNSTSSVPMPSTAVVGDGPHGPDIPQNPCATPIAPTHLPTTPAVEPTPPLRPDLPVEPTTPAATVEPTTPVE